MISGIIEVEADYNCLIIHCFMCFMCEMQEDFICASKNTRKNAPSGRITRNHSSAFSRSLAIEF